MYINYLLSHRFPCFQCNIAIEKIVLLHKDEIMSFNPFIKV